MSCTVTAPLGAAALGEISPSRLRSNQWLRFAVALVSLIGQLALFAFSAALVYHFLNGIRHLLWDAGWGFEIPKAYASGYAVLVLAVKPQVMAEAARSLVAANSDGTKNRKPPSRPRHQKRGCSS